MEIYAQEFFDCHVRTYRNNKKNVPLNGIGINVRGTEECTCYNN